jgi:hypothetical protein
MMAFVKLVRESNLEAIERPVLVIYSPNDQVINPTLVEEKTLPALALPIKNSSPSKSPKLLIRNGY